MQTASSDRTSSNNQTIQGLCPVCRRIPVPSVRILRTECEVTRCNLITEWFTDLSDTKWQFLSGGTLYILEAYEDLQQSPDGDIPYSSHPLVTPGMSWTLGWTDGYPVMLPHVGHGIWILIDKVLHLLLCPRWPYCTIQFNVILCTIIFDDFIRTETLVTLFTIHQMDHWILRDVHLRIHVCGFIWSHSPHFHIERRFLNEFLPPCFFYIVFQFYSEINYNPMYSQARHRFRSRIQILFAFANETILSIVFSSFFPSPPSKYS